MAQQLTENYFSTEILHILPSNFRNQLFEPAYQRYKQTYLDKHEMNRLNMNMNSILYLLFIERPF